MDTKTFELTRTVRDEDVETAKEEIQAVLEDLQEQIPDAVVSEITTEPASEERSRPLRYSEVHMN